MEMTNAPLQLLQYGQTPRLNEALHHALQGVAYTRLTDIRAARPGPRSGPGLGRLLFAVAIDETGINLPLYEAMAALRASDNMLEGCVGGAIIDGEGELYTRSVGRELLQSANGCGCVFPGRPLTEATGLLRNFAVLAETQGVRPQEAYHGEARALVGRIMAYEKPRQRLRPRLLVLYASNKETSNTYALWEMVRRHIGDAAEIREIALRNGAVADCEGCAYTACLHMGEKGGCFYGGAMVEEVYPALPQSDAVILLCPNYNDAVDANIAACINRLTALYRAQRFYGKSLFGIVVSGYSGGDIVARQLISAMCVNKSFQLPPRFCMMETANDPGSIRNVPGIKARAEAFGEAMLRHLTEGAQWEHK